MNLRSKVFKIVERLEKMIERFVEEKMKKLIFPLPQQKDL